MTVISMGTWLTSDNHFQLTCNLHLHHYNAVYTMHHFCNNN